MRGSGLSRFLVLTGVACLGWSAVSVAVAAFEPVTDDMLAAPDPAHWLMWRRTLDAWGYSPLDELNTGNVEQLRMVWSRPLTPGMQEGTPLVYDGVMYFPNPGDVIQAIDVRSGEVIWEHRRRLPDDVGDYLPFFETNRTLAIHGRHIIHTSADAHIYALDAETGEQVWETRIMDYRRGAKHSSGPIIANGLAISGRSCEPEGGPDACVITAHDAETGREVWRTSTIARDADPNSASWGDVPLEERIHVGAWMIPSFDPGLNLIYMGTSVTGPAPKILMAGIDKQYLYHNSTLALDADSGDIIWYYQHMVDHWDLDHPFERMLLDTRVAPDPDDVLWINPGIDPEKTYKVMTGVPGKTGIIYTLDRESGEFLWARPTTFQNVVGSIDGDTGRVHLNPATVFTELNTPVMVCPSMSGGKNFMAGAYSPLTHTMYLPAQNTCATVSAVEDSASTYALASRQYITPDTDNVGTIHAVNAGTGKDEWTLEQRAAMLSLMTTGGGLLFTGDSHGRFRALDQQSGDRLWEINLGSSVTGYPATFEVDGHQYVAVSTGRWLNDTYTPEHIHGTQNTLYVFALPGAGIGHEGPYRPPVNPQAAAPELAMDITRSINEGVYSEVQAARGLSVYSQYCAQCHGQDYQGAPGSPAVVGATFMANWRGQSVDALYTYIKNTMPPGQGGLLDDQEYLSAIAHLLEVNGVPSGDEALPVERQVLGTIGIE